LLQTKLTCNGSAETNPLVYWYSLTGQKAYHADKFSTDKHSTMLVQRTTHTTPTHTLTSPPVVLVYQKQTNKCMQPTSTHQAESTTYKQIQLKQNNVTLVTENKCRQKGK